MKPATYVSIIQINTEGRVKFVTEADSKITNWPDCMNTLDDTCILNSTKVKVLSKLIYILSFNQSLVFLISGL